MMKNPPLFQPKVLQNALVRFGAAQIPNLAQKREILTKWKQTIEAGKLKQAGEVALHGDFLGDLFGTVLGYTRLSDGFEEWNLALEQKTLLDATKADGALGFFTQGKTDIRGIIELKNAAADLDAKQSKGYQKQTPVEQAFSYAPKHGKQCQWVLVSNYLELRLYHASSQVEYERFLLADLTNEQEFRRFYFLLARDHLLAKEGVSPVESLYRKSEEVGARISKQFYADYTAARLHLFEHLKQQARSYRFSDGPESDKSLTTNQALTTKEELFLLEKTQKLLDRFIFICFCEDTGMLPPNTFRKLLRQAQESFVFVETKHKIWPALKGLFKALDMGWKDQQIPKFNGELFKPDAGLDALVIGDEIFSELAEIADYDFESDLNVNILGHIFEQSISDLEELRAGIRGEELDRKQGKRKKEGIFYTPEYITRYIVEQAVGGWLEDRKRELGVEDLPELTQTDLDSIKLVKSRYKGNKKVEQHRAFWEAYRDRLANMTVLDPACGSGAFLNQAFRFLYEEGERVNAALSELSQGQRSAFDLHKHILSHNLYGVDINKESVEITKLSLWLLTARKDAELTALDDNIKCGNSLIDDPLIAGDKAFKWEKEFPEIMQNGGFDVVIGNPPYVRQETLGQYKPYFERMYRAYHGMADLYVYFIEQGVSLLKPKGILSYIVSNKWIRASYGEPLRIWLKHQHIHEIIDFGDLSVFEDATTYPCIIKLSPDKPAERFNACEVETLEFSHLTTYLDFKRYPVMQSLLQDEGWALVDERQQKLLDKLKKSGVPLGEYVLKKIFYGIKTGLNEAFVIDENTRKQLMAEDSKSEELIKPFLTGKDIKRYEPPETEQFLILIPSGWTDERSMGIADKWTWLQAHYPAIARHLEAYAEAAQKRYDKGGYWWELRPCSYYSEFEKSKIIYPNICKRPEFSLDNEGFYTNQKCFIIASADKYLLALLNSQITFFLFRLILPKLRGDFYEPSFVYFKDFPIRPINFSDPGEKAQHDFIVERVAVMLDLHTQRQALDAQFLKLLTAEFFLPKIGGKLQHWSELDWKDFEKELQKAKAKLSLAQKSEWMSYFEQQHAVITAIQRQIAQTDQEIDRMVYELYGLTEEEIKVVEGKP